jgi:hypothetical protein
MKKVNKIAAISILSILLASIIVVMLDDSITPTYPKNGSAITDTNPLFKWEGDAEKILIDDNIEFVSPILEAVDGNEHKLNKNLEFSDYYWKLIGKKNSTLSTFSVQSIVAMKYIGNQSSSLQNIGNTDLNVEISEKTGQNWILTGFVVLEQNQSAYIGNSKLKLIEAKQR